MARRERAIIRYDGPALSGHEMDVHDLAPALLAIGDLCKVANEALNGSAASVKVLVRADVEQKCFQLQLELVQTLYEQFTTLLDSDGVQDAKNILEWLGIGAAGVSAAGGSLFWLYKQLWGKRSESDVSIEASAKDGSIVYQIVGDGNQIVVAPEVHKIAQDPRALAAVKKFLGPLEREGYETLEFEIDGLVTQRFTKEEAARIVAANPDAIVVRSERELVSTIKTTVGIRKAAFEGASKWELSWKQTIEANIADVDWLHEFQQGRVTVLPKTRLLVDLEERAQLDENENEIGKPSYKVLKVYGIVPPEHQESLFEKP